MHDRNPYSPAPAPEPLENPLVGAPTGPESTVIAILLAMSFSHLLNDTMQSLLPAIYPVLKVSYALTFAQIGLITLANQMTASILQPLVGFYTDRYPKPFSLAVGMAFTLAGLVMLSFASQFLFILLAAMFVGMGSSVFHPEASRITRMASGGKHGFAQSLFQVGGNAGTSLGPLLAAWIIVPRGQSSILWFSLIALTGIVILVNVGRWYKSNTDRLVKKAAAKKGGHTLTSRRVMFTLGVLVMLVFSKYFYLSSMANYYTFFVIEKFHLSVQTAQYFLFIFLFAVAAGTFIGGPIGDRIGRKSVIWVSILGVAPFTLLLPYANLVECGILTAFIGVILASAFSAILVYAQELVPGNVGMIAGLFFGLAFGMGGIGSAVLGLLADHTSINYVFHVCSYLPLLGIFTILLPNIEGKKR